jgi:hypothetical protein
METIIRLAAVTLEIPVLMLERTVLTLPRKVGQSEWPERIIAMSSG